MLTRKQSAQCLTIIACALLLLVLLQSCAPADGTYAGSVQGEYEALTLRDGQLIFEEEQVTAEYRYLFGMLYLNDGETLMASPMIGGRDCLYTPLGDTMFRFHRFDRIS